MVADNEQVYRSVKNDPKLFPVVDGVIRFSSQCFGDRAYKVSVDRAILREPEQAKLSPTDGIVRLLAQQIREIEPIANLDGGIDYIIDIHARPIPEDNPDGHPANPAHAQIEASPDFANNSRFKKLKEALAQLAMRNGWFVEPS